MNIILLCVLIFCLVMIHTKINVYCFIVLLSVLIIMVLCNLYQTKHIQYFSNRTSETQFDYYTDIQDCKQTLVSIIQNADDLLYFSSYACNMLTTFYKQHTMQQLLNDATKRGVKVYILYNVTAEYSNHPISTLKQILDPSIHIYQVSTDDVLESSVQPISKQIGYSFNHMKFILTKKQCMLGGCDIDPWERLGYEKVNRSGFSWHEVSISFTPTKHVFNYLSSLFKNQSILNIPKPPNPLTTNIYEMKQYLWMIQNAKTTLYIEHQLLAMTKYSKKWSNRFIQAIANRIDLSCKKKDDFVCTIITNVSQDDETSPFTQAFSRSSVMVSLCSIIQYCSHTLTDIQKRLQVYTLVNKDNIPVKTHSNVIITDDKNGVYHCIRSSSNLSDRSFGKYSCDLELGIYISGDKVKQLFFDLLSLHTHTKITKYKDIHKKIESSYLQPIFYECDMLSTSIFKITQTHSSSGDCKELFNFKNI